MLEIGQDRPLYITENFGIHKGKATTISAKYTSMDNFGLICHIFHRIKSIWGNVRCSSIQDFLLHENISTHGQLTIYLQMVNANVFPDVILPVFFWFIGDGVDMTALPKLFEIGAIQSTGDVIMFRGIFVHFKNTPVTSEDILPLIDAIMNKKLAATTLENWTTVSGNRDVFIDIQRFKHWLASR